MKKTILYTAVATAIVLPATVQADATVYGEIHNTIMKVDASDGGVTAMDQWQVHDPSSKLGFKGSEDLGGGMQAIWKLEQAYDTDGANAITGGDNTYIGLTGPFGTVLVGRADTPYKTAWNAGGVDFLGDTVADMNGTGIGGNAVGDVHFDEDRKSNIVSYVSPSMSGLRAAFAVIPGETSGVEDGLADSWSGGLMYAVNGLKIGAGMESLADATANTPDETRWHLTGSYAYEDFTLGASYAHVSDDNYVDGDKKQTWGLSAQYAFGNNAVGANYRFSDLENAANGNGDIKSWAVFLAHTMSERTKVYVAYAQHEYDGASAVDQETTEYGIGIIHTF